MKRVSFTVVAASVFFLALGLPTGVNAMVNPDYCVTHDDRPPDTSFHEESLSFVPPGPTCKFFLKDGTSKTAGPGWLPAVVLLVSLVVALATWRQLEPTEQINRSRPRVG